MARGWGLKTIGGYTIYPPMPPPTHPPGLHVVIKGLLHPAGTEWFKDISGCCIGQHKEGLTQKERPHYHIWLPNTYTVKNVKADLRKYYDTLIPDLKWNTHANAYYTVKDHDSFQNWKEYVFNPDLAECKKPTVELWNSLEPRPIISDINDLVFELPHDESKVVKKEVSKRANASVRFLEFCRKEDITHPTIREVTQLWVEWTKGSYELRNVTAPIRHVFYILNDEDPLIKDLMVDELLDRFPGFQHFGKKISHE